MLRNAMHWNNKYWLLIFHFLFPSNSIFAQTQLTITQPQSGIKLIVTNRTFPLLKILLPGQPATDRGIEIEFPEHVTGLNEKTNRIEHLYLVTRGNSNKRTFPEWKIEGTALIYESTLNGNIKLTARVTMDSIGVSYTYTFINNSTIPYRNFQAVTCVKLYSDFSDTLLERTYVHHSNGFELLASETPQRLTMGLQQWLPCRYLISYTWPVPDRRMEKGEDGIKRYHKSRKVDQPFIATLSHDKKWVAATFTHETGNLWTNPERSCQHADPSVSLKPGKSKSLKTRTFVFKGSLDKVLDFVNSEKQKNISSN